MRKFLFYSLVGLCVCTGALSSCQKGEGELPAASGKQDAVLMKVPLHIGQVPMEEKNASPGSRATMPMGPEQENPMRTLAVIQFDSEGNMLEINEGHTHPHYHFFTLTDDDNPSGVINTDLDGVSLFSSEGRKTRVCLIANETEAGIDSLIWDKEENRRLLWNEFRIRTIEISYKLPEEGTRDSLGHVKDIYMYGHYEGELTQNNTGSPEVGGGRPLSISLARIIARVEMNIKLGDEVSIPEDRHVFFGMYNVEKSAYLVPEVAEYLPASPVHSHITFNPVDRTERLSSEKSAIFYFYMAPHVVQDHRDNVTYFAIWCVPEDVTGEELQQDKTDAEKNGTQPEYPYAKVLMCNDPLTEGDTPSAEGAYWLNRNSIYHVNLTLTYTDEETVSRSMPDGRYVINLKRLMGN